MSLHSSELAGLPRRGSRSAFFPYPNRLFTRWAGLVLLGWLACLAGAFPAANAQTNTTSQNPPANRFLFLVETSRTMQSRSEGTLQVLQDLLGSGLNGQMREGDSLGLWTFNSQLHAGQFPLQDWSPKAQRTISLRMVNFLKSQTYERKANFDRVWPSLTQVLQDSPFLTVVLISSGETEIRGTPFDRPINESYKTWRDQQQQAQMPFVAVLRAKAGTITHYAVAATPWPLELPPLPSELLPAPAVAKPAATPSRKPQPVLAQPLILSGKKPTPVPAPKPVESVPAQLPPASESASVQTNQLETQPAAPAAEPPSLTNQTSTPIARVTEPAPAITLAAKATPPEPPQPPASSVASPAESLATPSADPAPPAAAPLAVAKAAPASFQLPGIWVGSLLLVAACAGLWFWTRRSRPASHVSLITQSLDRQKR